MKQRPVETEIARRQKVIHDHVFSDDLQQNNHALVDLECYRCFCKIKPGEQLTEGYDPETGKAFYVCWPCVKALQIVRTAFTEAAERMSREQQP